MFHTQLVELYRALNRHFEQRVGVHEHAAGIFRARLETSAKPVLPVCEGDGGDLKLFNAIGELINERRTEGNVPVSQKRVEEV